MTSRHAQTPDSRKALANLATVAAGFVRGRGRNQARENLRFALHLANQVLRVERQDVSSGPVTDPEQLVRQYIEQGGDWQKLVAAVSRLSLEGATRRHE